jgi:hypothetical protein
LDATEACFREQTNKKPGERSEQRFFCLGKPLVEVSVSLKVIQFWALFRCSFFVFRSTNDDKQF